MSTEELLAHLLQLSREERSRVASAVLISLEEPEETAAAAWSSELGRRARQIAGGEAQAIAWETARTEIRSELAARRARKTAS